MTGNQGKAWHAGLWLAQAVLAIAYGFFGFMKASRPLEELAPVMTWVSDFPPAFVRGLGVVEVLGAVGLILPSLLRIRPGITVLAAAAIFVHQGCAITLHVSRGEFAALPLNGLLIGLAAIIAFGRARKARIPSRY